MSALGHSRPSQSAPEPTNVRYASNSDQILRCNEMTLSANSGHPSVIELIVILSCFRHQVDACGQCPDRPPNGIH